MNKSFVIFLLIIYASCNGSVSKTESTDSLITKNTDTSKSHIKGDTSLTKLTEASHDTSSILPRSQADERRLLMGEYDQSKTIDSTYISDNDTLHFHLTYICLKNEGLTVPKSYDRNKQNPQDFATHPFASNVLLIHNRDTVLKKQFVADDFSPSFKDNFGGNLKKYGSLSMPHLSRRNKDKSRVVLICNIAIPSTDIGIDLYLEIEKTGHYNILQDL